jgi:hypothetical protein
MYLWCQNDLQNTMSDWIVAFWHHPAYSKGSHDSDTEGRLVEMRQNFLPLLESYGVDLVLSGHSHSYERSFFLNGHYGNSDTFDPLLHTVGITGNGNGRSDGEGAYLKGIGSSSGATYITGGSSGQVSTSGALNHEAMYYSVADLGSCILEVDGGIMEVKFLNNEGTIGDYFTIEKELDCVTGASCDDMDVCTVNDTINEHCQCIGTPISGFPGTLLLDETETPLAETYKALQAIIVSGNVGTQLNSLTSLIAPEVVLQPTFQVVLNSTLVVLQEGCD